VEEENCLTFVLINQVFAHLLEFIHCLVNIRILDKGSDHHFLRRTLSRFFLLYHHSQAALLSHINVFEELLGLGFRFLLDDCLLLVEVGLVEVDKIN
jgi:hypothetical protein